LELKEIKSVACQRLAALSGVADVHCRQTILLARSRLVGLRFEYGSLTARWLADDGELVIWNGTQLVERQRVTLDINSPAPGDRSAARAA